MKDNFENFNFPKENDQSFTVNIQHDQDELWQECLKESYGEPHVKKNSCGTECDKLWKFEYLAEERKTDLTVHIYIKPKQTKKS